MNESKPNQTSRRGFMKTTGCVAGASALLGGALPSVHAGENGEIRVALIGCGGRGSGAAANALSVQGGPIKLVAMGDVFEDKMKSSYTNLKKQYGDKVDVPEDRRFLGFDAYKKAIDCLSPGDVAIFATPPAFRWVHFTYAIQKGINVFMEKPVTVDGPTTKRMIELSKQADKKNLKVGVGLMVRHCRGRQQLHKRIQEGEIGDIVAIRAYRMGGPFGAGPKPDDMTEVMFQVRRFHSFIWASGGVYSDFYIHQIDECSWMKNAWPVQAEAIGGRQYRGNQIDQNLDTYGVEYTYPDGTKLFYYGRNMGGCPTPFCSYAHGAKGTAVISTRSHHPGGVRLFSDQKMEKDKMIWRFPGTEPNPYQMEWDDLIAAIRNDEPYNEAERGAIASLVTSMGRMAAHTGQIITYEDMLNCPHEMAPNVDKLSPDGPAPVQPDDDGKYPQPLPGLKKDREY
jgi:predicted dehydrogenase